MPWLWELALKPEGGQGAAHRGVEAAGLAAERGRRSGPAAAVAWTSRSRSWGGSSGLLDPEVRSVEVLRRYIGGQGGPVLYDGEQLLGKPCTYDGDSRGESRRCRDLG